VIIDADTLFGFWPSRHVDVSLDKLQRLMERHNVELACACSARGICYDFQEGNQETIDVARSNSCLVPVLTVDPRRYLGVAEEVRRRVAEGHKVFRLYPEYQNWTVNTPSARKVLSILEDAGATIMLGGTAAQAIPEIRSLQVPVILTWVHYYYLSDVLAYADEMPHLYLSTRFLIGPRSLEIAVSALGAERLIYGSQAPLVSMASALKLVLTADLTPDQRGAILSGNMQRLLGNSLRS